MNMRRNYLIVALLVGVSNAYNYPDAPYIGSDKSFVQTSFCKINLCKSLGQVRLTSTITEEYYDVRFKNSSNIRALVVTKREGKVRRIALRTFGQDYWPESDEVEIVKFASGIDALERQLQKISDSESGVEVLKNSKGKRFPISVNSLPFSDVADIWFVIDQLP